MTRYVIGPDYVALTRLQADAFVTLDTDLAEAVKGLVEVVPLDDLAGSRGQSR